MTHRPVLLIFLIAFFMRSLYLSQGAFLFSYDQARDAYTVRELLSGDIKIQGPPTSTRDFFHGVLYYYAVAPGYWLGQGSPIIAALWLAFLNSLGVFLVYYFALQLFKTKLTAGWAALMFAFSYEQTQYAFYLANPALAALTVPLLYFGLYRAHQRRPLGYLLAGIGLGLSFQANFIFIYHLTAVIFLLIFRVLPLSRSGLVKFLAGFLIASSTMIISEIKFGFPSRVGPGSLLTRSHYSALNVDFSAISRTAFNQFQRLVSLNLAPAHPGLALSLFALSIVYLLVSRPPWWPVFTLGLFSFAPPLILGGIGTPYIHAGLGTIVIIIIVHWLQKLPPGVVVPILSVIIISNTLYIRTRNSQGLTEFAIQKTMTLQNELAAVDYVYREAEGQPFSINTVTAPLNINTTWSYLFNWYGQKVYGYLPYWHGPDQTGRPGDNLSRPGVTSRYFLIIEPSQGLPEDLINSAKHGENQLSHFNHLKKFGEITVHSRTRKI